jgi:hypothetical protein
MPLMLGALYRALREAQVGDEHAQQAAEEVAAYDARLHIIESRLTLVTWMLGVVIALLIGVFWQGFTIMGRLPR